MAQWGLATDSEGPGIVKQEVAVHLDLGSS